MNDTMTVRDIAHPAPMRTDLVYAKLPDNHTDADILAEISRLQELKTDYGNKDAALKVILNSIYGVAGYQKFILYDRDVAQSITAQCVHLTKYTISSVNEFFKERFHTYTDLHKALGIATPEPWTDEVVNYADTDSMFFVLGPLRKQCGHTGHPVDFIMITYQMYLKEFIRKRLEDYVIDHNGYTTKEDGTPAVELDLEEICKSVLWVASKMYIKDPIFVKKKRIESMSKLTVKGLALNQAATPKYIRGKLQDFVKMVMGSENLDLSQLITWLAQVKREFKSVSPEMISRVERANDYRRYVIEDTTRLVIGANCKPQTKGAGYYNLLLGGSDFKRKYDYIRSGHKVHFYYTRKGTACEVFSFLPDAFPVEFAPPVDIDVQFEKILLGPINNILRAMGVPPLTSSLVLFGSLW